MFQPIINKAINDMTVQQVDETTKLLISIADNLAEIYYPETVDLMNSDN